MRVRRARGKRGGAANGYQTIRTHDNFIDQRVQLEPGFVPGLSIEPRAARVVHERESRYSVGRRSGYAPAPMIGA